VLDTQLTCDRRKPQTILALTQKKLRLLVHVLTIADIFGGDLPYEQVVTWQRQQEAAAASTA
jgi:hypothetical protein